MLQMSGDGFVAPGSSDFELPAIFNLGALGVTKPMLQVIFAVAVIAIFFVVVGRNMKLVPGRTQFLAEGIYSFVRNGIGRDVIGSHDFAKFVPLLLSLFTFVYINNLFGVLPFVQFPTMSRIGFPIALTIVVWLTYLYVGVRKQGFYSYFKNMMFPPGVPKPVYVLLAPIELLQGVITRPLTLALRLFANMFAGHLLLLVFIIGGEAMLTGTTLLSKVLSPAAFAMGIVLTFFEALVQLLQAYIFTLLTALYIASSLSEEH